MPSSVLTGYASRAECMYVCAVAEGEAADGGGDAGGAAPMES